MHAFIDPARAEDRNVLCGWCGLAVKGHLSGCPHCHRPFYANMHGYARLCKSNWCCHTECQNKPNGLCKAHLEARRERQARTAAQPKCHCGNKMAIGAVQCRGCDWKDEQRALEAQRRSVWFDSEMKRWIKQQAGE